MSAALILSQDPVLDQVLDEGEVQSCRFCHCTDERPCKILIAVDSHARLARNEAESIGFRHCSWYLGEVCDAPECLEKLLAEWREISLMDLVADERDWALLGNELGIKEEELTRELVVERIRELRKMAERKTA